MKRGIVEAKKGTCYLKITGVEQSANLMVSFLNWFTMSIKDKKELIEALFWLTIALAILKAA